LSLCFRSDGHHSRVVFVSFLSSLDVDVSRPQSVCGDCLVGWTVPVLRKQLKEWELGLVEQFNPETQEHCIQFDDEQQEWATVEVSPFTAYVSHYKEEWADKKMQHHTSRYSTDFHADSGSNSYKFEDYFKVRSSGRLVLACGSWSKMLIDFQKVHRRFNSPLRSQSSSKNPKMTGQSRFVAAAEEDKKKAAIKEDTIGGTYKSPQKATTPSSDSLASPSSTDTEKTNQARLWTVEVSFCVCNVLCLLPAQCFPLFVIFLCHLRFM
jgi:hypothetical protein